MGSTAPKACRGLYQRGIPTSRVGSIRMQIEQEGHGTRPLPQVSDYVNGNEKDGHIIQRASQPVSFEYALIG